MYESKKKETSNVFIYKNPQILKINTLKVS